MIYVYTKIINWGFTLMKSLSIFKRTLLLFSGVFLFVSVYANTASDASNSSSEAWNAHQGSYIQADLGTNLYILALFSGVGDFSSTGVDGTAWDLAYGYQFHRGGVALEAGFSQSYVTTTVDATAVNVSTGSRSTTELDSSFTIDTPYVAFRFEVPIFHSDRLAFTPKIGLMYLSIPKQTTTQVIDGLTYTGSNSDSGGLVLPMVGLGLSYALNPRTNIGVQYQGLVLGIVNLGTFTGGINYHF